MKLQKQDFKIFRYFKNYGIAALIMGAAILFYGCENDIEKIKAFSSPEDLPTLEAVNFQTLYTDSGQVRYSLKTPKLLKFDNEGNEYLEFPEGMELVQFNAKNEVVSSLKADYAKQFLKEEKWEAKNNVVATNEVGDTLKTEHLIWEEKTEKIYTEEFVEITRPDEVYTGIGLTADQSLVNWRIKKLKGIAYVTVDNNRTKSNNSNKADASLKKNKDKPFDGPLKFKN
jgi:LPS export ABC transporter protein LptC